MDTLDSIQKMKQWSACIVSTILYVRRFFSEVDYADYQYNNNITLKVLSKLSNSNRVQAIIEHLQDVFDAIDKEYLQMLMIEVIGQAERQDGGSADEVVETYSIEYTKRDIFDPNAQESITSNVASMVHNLMAALYSIPPASKKYAYSMSIRMFYHDDNDIDKLAPKNFVIVHNRNNNKGNVVDVPFISQKIGVVNTAHHSMKIALMTKQLPMKQTPYLRKKEDMHRNIPRTQRKRNSKLTAKSAPKEGKQENDKVKQFLLSSTPFKRPRHL